MKNTQLFEELNKTPVLHGNVSNHGLVHNSFSWKK
jgi:hypothetical protein